LSVNSPLIVFNNSGGEFQAKFVGIAKWRAEIILGEFILVSRESPLAIYLGQGISRGEKMDFTIQKAVELGVQTITPLFTKYYNVKFEGKWLEKRMLHWQSVAVSAAEQSKRCCVPKILPATSLAAWNLAKESDLYLVFDPDAPAKFSSIKQRPSRVTILIGPEGGLSREEIEQTKQQGFVPTTLGPRILRTETAALAAISILQARWGDV